MSEFDYSPTRQFYYNMSRNEVVGVLQGELVLLREELNRRDKVIDDRVKQLSEDFEGYHEIDKRRWCMSQLVEARAFREANLRIHDDLRPVAVATCRDGANAWDQTDG